MKKDFRIVLGGGGNRENLANSGFGGATHVAHRKNSRKVAFTLAEVLITLGIIGVVAALTMPVLIENHKKQVIISKLDKAYSTISNAYVLAKEANGDMENWGLVEYQSATKNEEDFLYYISPFLSVQKYCGKAEGCFPDVGYGSIGTTNFGVNMNRSTWYSKAILTDGSMISSITFNNSTSVVRIDVNGPKAPNVMGIDLFNFIVLPDKVIPQGVGDLKQSSDYFINRGDYCASQVIYNKTMDYIKDKKCLPYN